MKKVIILFLCILLGAGSFVFYQKKVAERSIHPELFLPQDTLVYIHQKNLGNILSSFNQTPLKKALDKIDFVRLALDLEFSFDTVTKIRLIRDFLMTDRAKLIFQEYLSKDFSVALLPVTDQATPDKLVQQHLVLFCKPRHRFFRPRMLKPFLGDEIDLKTTPYGEHILYRAKVNDELSLSLVYADNLLLVSFDEITVRKLLDRYDEHGSNLGEDFFFKEATATPSTRDLFCFFKIEDLIHHIDKRVPSDGGIAFRILRSLRKWKGFTTGTIDASRTLETALSSVQLHFNDFQLDEQTQYFLAVPTVKNHSITLIPKNTFFYYWSNTFNLEKMWKIFSQESGEDDLMLKDFRKGIAEISGVSFNQLLELPDGLIHLVMLQTSFVDSLPVPNFSLFFSLSDRETTQNVTKRFLMNYTVPHRTNVYKNISYTYWGEQVQDGLQPSYAFYDDYLIISSSVHMQKIVIDTISGAPDLRENPKFTAHTRHLSTSNNSCLYLELDQFLEMVKKLSKWSSTMIGIQNRKAAMQSQILIDELIIPILDSMVMYSSVASRSYAKDGRLTVETRISRKE